MDKILFRAYTILLLAVHANALDKSKHYGTRLHKKLFTDYYPDVRPLVDHTKPVTVNVKLSLLRIHHVNEISQSLKTTVNLFLYWTDELLTWNATEFEDLNEMVFPYQENIWIPDLMLINALDKPGELGIKEAFIALANTGKIMIWTQVNFDTSCEIKTKKYPFDEQHCQISFTKFMNDDKKVAIYPMENKTNLDEYVKTAEWIIQKNFVSTKVVGILDENFEQKIVNYTMIYFNLLLQRNCHSCIINIIMPVLVLAFLNLLTFFVPCGSGEKTSFPISIFLTLAVFLTVITHSLPESVDGVSYLSSFVTFQLAVSAVTLLSAVTSLQIYNKNHSRPVPKLGLVLIKVFKSRHHQPAARKLKVVQRNSHNNMSRQQEDRNADQCTMLERQQSNSLHGVGIISSTQWADVADAFDRLMFFVLLLSEVVTTVTFLALIMG